jgi:hypothetical protein
MQWRALVLGILGVGLAQLAVPTAARADFLTNPQVLTIPLTPTDWGPTTTVLTGLDPFVLKQFNPATYSSGGKTAVLLGVEVKMSYEFDNTLSMKFDNMSTITVKATGNMQVDRPNGSTLLPTPNPAFTNFQSMTANPATVLGKTVTFPTQVYTGSVSSPTGGFTDSTSLTQFKGTGTISLPVVATATSTFTTSSGNGFGASVTDAKAVITVVYRYALVPEPSSLALAGLGGGCVALVGVCRSRKRSRLKV